MSKLKKNEKNKVISFFAGVVLCASLLTVQSCGIVDAVLDTCPGYSKDWVSTSDCIQYCSPCGMERDGAKCSCTDLD